MSPFQGQYNVDDLWLVGQIAEGVPMECCFEKRFEDILGRDPALFPWAVPLPVDEVLDFITLVAGPDDLVDRVCWLIVDDAWFWSLSGIIISVKWTWNISLTSGLNTEVSWQIEFISDWINLFYYFKWTNESCIELVCAWEMFQVSGGKPYSLSWHVKGYITSFAICLEAMTFFTNDLKLVGLFPHLLTSCEPGVDRADVGGRGVPWV